MLQTLKFAIECVKKLKFNSMKQIFFLKASPKLLALCLSLMISVGAFAQIQVKGLVKDDLGEPLIGAKVATQSGDAATVTDFDGNFHLSVPKGTTLVISYMGFITQEVTASPSMVITMSEDAKALEDVIVIGYGHAKKGDLTGSVSAMNPDDMSKGITNNATDMLVGKIAGVDVITSGGMPGAGAQIRIRGGSSLNASNDPLFVIDGLVIDGSTATGMSNILGNINPNDIETFTVLKDASATAIYGSRASNGVIIITTKKGKGSAIPKVSYSGDVTVSTIQKKYDALDGNEYRALVNRIDGLDASLLGNANTNWQDQIFRTAISNSHNISLNGALDKMPYRLTVGYNSADGIVKTSSMRRTNVSLNLAPSLFDKHLTFGITGKYMYEEDRYANAGGAIGSALSIDPTRPVYDDGIVGRHFAGYWQPTLNAEFNNPNWTLYKNSNAPQNPLALLNNQYIMAHAHDFIGNFDVEYKIHGFEDLSLHANFGGQYTKSHQDDYSTPYSFDNNYYGWDGVTNYMKWSATLNAYAQYTHNWNKKHNFTIMAGAEESRYHREGWNAGQGWEWYDEEGNLLATPTAYGESLRGEQEWATHNRLVSYLSRVDYTLLDRYLFTASFRADGSSRFSKGAKSRWGYFPAAAFAWRISGEKFMQKANWLDDLKLRLSYGQTGQQEIGSDFPYQTVYTVSNQYAMYPFGDTYYYTARPSAVNKNLKWETTTTYNAGIDFSAKNGRFVWNLDAYLRKTTDLIQWKTISVGTAPASILPMNIGDLKNYGVEFSFDIKPVVTKNFTWDLQYNVAWNHNEITSLTGGAGDDDYRITTGSTISRGNGTSIMAHHVGQPASAFWVYQQVYGEDGKPLEGVYVDRNADGQINDQDRYYYKKPAADWIMGLTSKFIYKNWDLSIAFHASIGNYIYYDHLSNYASISSSGLYSNSAFTNTFPEAVELGFTGEGTEYFLSDYFVRNASYLKCSNITLGYSFPGWERNGRKLMDGGRIFFTAQNPFFITKYKGLDPEVTGGVDRNPYPRPMSFQVGLNLNF